MEKGLTEQQKKKIWDVIISKMVYGEDREPINIIADTFNGDEEAYLQRMVAWHHINLD